MIARIIIPLILTIVLPDVYFDIVYLRRRYKYTLRKRLLWLIPGFAMLVYSVVLASIKNFVPDDLFWINLYIALLALYVGPKALLALFSFLGLMLQKLTHSHRNWGNPLGVAACLFGIYIFIYGYTAGFRKLDVTHVELAFNDLPEVFDGYRIVQFSDAHVGTFTGSRKDLLRLAVDSINAQRPDAVMFTGDIQNVQPSELRPAMPLLSSVKARDGVYSVLGNHDYSSYIGKSGVDKAANERLTISLERQMGWRLLLNENQCIRRGRDSIVIAGEENDGSGKFISRANLRKTLSGVGANAFVIMLQHDPSAWRRNILPKSNARLTLSGHTHGGQLSIFGFRPSHLVVGEDKGLYESHGRYLYVNSGLGGVVPFRFGVSSEITVITLHKKK